MSFDKYFMDGADVFWRTTWTRLKPAVIKQICVANLDDMVSTMEYYDGNIDYVLQYFASDAKREEFIKMCLDDSNVSETMIDLIESHQKWRHLVPVKSDSESEGDSESDSESEIYISGEYESESESEGKGKGKIDCAIAMRQ